MRGWRLCKLPVLVASRVVMDFSRSCRHGRGLKPKTIKLQALDQTEMAQLLQRNTEHDDKLDADRVRGLGAAPYVLFFHHPA